MNVLCTLRDIKNNENWPGQRRLSQDEIQVKVGRMPWLRVRRRKDSGERIKEP